jgi:selenocysteine lyase/cysteine desulfurase
VTFEEARARFPVLERYAYLNAGTNGPLARQTTEAVLAWERRELEEGRGGQPYFEAVMGLREPARSGIAEVLNVPPENVSLVSSTTNGCLIVLAGLDLEPEDEVVTTDVEHFGLLGALHASGARVRVVEPTPEAILDQVNDRTRLIAISHISWMTGNVIDPGVVKENTDVPILVDGAQSAGAIPLGAADFDFYTVSAQKWLCAPHSSGALYVRDPERLRVALPTYLSQVSHDPNGSFEPKPGALRFDSVWAPAPLAGLLEALKAAPDWRYDRIAEMAQLCRDRLVDAGYDVVTEPDQGGLVAFVPNGEAPEVAKRLYERGVIVRDVPGRGWVRVSCGWWTSEEDIERLLETL